MLQLDRLLNLVLSKGEDYERRQGVIARSLIGQSYDCPSVPFPLTTKKHMPFDLILDETLWLLKGDTNVKNLKGRHWDKFANQNNSVGKSYGYQLRHKYDQLKWAIFQLVVNPNSSRTLIDLWQVPDVLEYGTFPPCMTQLHFLVRDKHLHLIVNQRSCDLFVGGYWNLAQAAIILRLVALDTGYVPGNIRVNIGDAHIYHSHFEAVQQYLERESLPLPELQISLRSTIDHYEETDFKLIGYKSHPRINVEVY